MSDEDDKKEKLRKYVLFAHNKAHVKGKKGHEIMKSVFKELGYEENGRLTIEEKKALEEKKKRATYEKIKRKREQLAKTLAERKQKIEDQISRLNELDVDKIADEMIKQQTESIRQSAEKQALRATKSIANEIKKISTELEKDENEHLADLNELTVDELRSIARDKDVSYSGLRKDELIKALAEA